MWLMFYARKANREQIKPNYELRHTIKSPALQLKFAAIRSANNPLTRTPGKNASAACEANYSRDNIFLPQKERFDN
jgi:hypothetical protein